MQTNNSKDDLYQNLDAQKLDWTTYCESGSCVAVADLGDGSVALRDSKLGEKSPLLAFTEEEMRRVLPELAKKYNLS